MPRLPRRQPDPSRELDRLLRSKQEATAEVEKARVRKDDAEARRPELAAIDGRQALDELTVEEAAGLRGDIESEITGAEQALERAERVLNYIGGRVIEAANAAADSIVSKPTAAVEKAERKRAEIAKQLDDADREVAKANAILSDARVEADRIREHDPTVAAAHRESERHAERLIDWALKNGTADGMAQVPAALRPEVERRRAELAAERRARGEVNVALRDRGRGEIFEGEPYPTIKVF